METPNDEGESVKKQLECVTSVSILKSELIFGKGKYFAFLY